MFNIEDATNTRTRVLAMLQSPTGCGKTFTALLMARGIVGPKGVIGVIDSEGGRSEMYANDPTIGGFKIIKLKAPHSSDRYKEAFRAMEAIADIIIIDSTSHEHQEMIEHAEREEKNGKKGVQKWTAPKIARKRFYSAVLNSDKHVILTMRMIEKIDMATLKDKDGAKRFWAVDGDTRLGFEMDLIIQLHPNHKAEFIKVPGPLRGAVAQGEMLGVEAGAKLVGAIPQAKPGDRKMKAILSNLEDAANSGMDILQEAYKAAYRNADAAGREALKGDLDRLKQIATNADIEAREDGAGEMEDNPFDAS